MNVGIKYMINIENLINSGVEKARKNKHDVIVSYVEKLDGIDAFQFIHSNIDHFVNENFYWQDAHSNLLIAGLGAAMTMNVTDINNRYENISEEWQLLVERSIINNPYPKVTGVGPVLFGGFSFDYVNKESNLWNNFSHGIFYVPKYMVTNVNSQSYFTMNIICTPDGMKEEDIEQILKERNFILQNSNVDNKIQVKEKMSLPNVIEKNSSLWVQQVRKAIHLLNQKYAKKVVLARDLHLLFENEIDRVALLQNLRDQQKNSYIFSLTSNEDCFIGATPERLVKKEGKRMFSACVAGSAPRGKTEDDDERMKKELLNDEKNLGEHQFVVDMITEAFQQLCESISKAHSPQIMTNKDIHHLYTPVEGWAKDKKSIFDFVKELHPTPALGGTPTEVALQMIRDFELFERGMYAGPIGWVDYRHNGEFVVAIRSGLIRDREAVLFAGCGIVRDSNPEKEFVETKVKFRPMLRALGGNIYE